MEASISCWDTATNAAVNSSASEQTPGNYLHAPSCGLLSAEYSRQGSVTQEQWDVSCDNLELLIVDDHEEDNNVTRSYGSTEMDVDGMGDLAGTLEVVQQHVPQCTNGSVVSGKRELESCLSSQPAAKRQVHTP